ncbi:DNA-deoxyinosine glycosylase [Flavobacterium sp. NST-5]|uniref:DNA-deoxyinosine glycosylase n=1 Tax=Flavobacterium ichthyis TaxID=2698827 RepID=A0ABW9Z8J8_9FLAO|nr:DNA-deoxyinosine glycosylase [Flavobacterium ichthyis]NBL65178.1 DNA-deoxyinosine glycosylase [Flavobacterium ichthyis]
MKKAFLPVIDEHSKILILGTMPGEKSLELQEYYGNKGNSFWKLIFTIFNKSLTQNYHEKLKLLTENNIALWDVLAFCERKGSLDTNIKNEVANDFEDLFQKYPNITKVFFSSKNAEKYYDKYIGRKLGIEYVTLPSPSGANASKTFEQKLEEWRQINI